MAKPFLSVIIPAFNEETRIGPTLEKLVGYLSRQTYSWEVLIIDDGSSDRTATLAGQWVMDHPGIRSETIPHSGKGWAVKYGMLATSGKYRFMCDIDLAMPVEWLSEFLEEMEKGYDIIIGSRQVTGARRFGESFVRHSMGRLFNWTVRLLAVRAFQDTQCGFKCFRGEVADALFKSQRTKGFGFDVEILYLAVKRSLCILEMPIDWYHDKSTKVRPQVDSFLMLRDILLLRWHALCGWYNSQHLQAGPETSPRLPPARTREQLPSNGLLTVVVPTYNESENLPELAARIFALRIPNTRLIIVDDNSPDGTAQVARELARRFEGDLEIIQRQTKLGLGTAYVEGFSRALAEGADYVLQMDADMSHEPEYIPELLAGLAEADVVVGSRYVEGGGLDAKWGLMRRLLSRLGNLGIRVSAGLRVKDATTGFKAFRANTLRSLELTRFRCKGFGFQVEVALACQRQGYRIVEHPITFVNRTRGQSKMSMFILLEAIWHLALIRIRR